MGLDMTQIQGVDPQHATLDTEDVQTRWAVMVDRNVRDADEKPAQDQNDDTSARLATIYVVFAIVGDDAHVQQFVAPDRAHTYDVYVKSRKARAGGHQNQKAVKLNDMYHQKAKKILEPIKQEIKDIQNELLDERGDLEDGDRDDDEDPEPVIDRLVFCGNSLGGGLAM